MTNLFEQFEGVDLDRLVKCLERVRSEGLTVDKYAQAGVNSSSGNVYIWSENWAGCVYCSIGFDVSWSYSCGECGEEYDFDTEQECRDYADKHSYKCEACNPLENAHLGGYQPLTLRQFVSVRAHMVLVGGVV